VEVFVKRIRAMSSATDRDILVSKGFSDIVEIGVVGEYKRKYGNSVCSCRSDNLYLVFIFCKSL
jgi:hypothetical protein